MGSVYAATLFLGIQNSLAVQPVVDVERTVFYRERAAGMYSALSYAFAQVLHRSNIIIVQVLVETYWIGFLHSLNFFRFWLKSHTFLHKVQCIV